MRSSPADTQPLDATHRRALLAILAVVIPIHAIGVWWGLPAMPHAWAPDEFAPETVRHGLERMFSFGWFELYPPFHLYLLAIPVGPIVLGDAAGLIRWTDPNVYTVAYGLMRLVSVAMASGIVLVTFRLGWELFDVRAGLFAALAAGLIVPLVFYAKLANVEVPYLFWLSLSLLHFVRILARHARRDYVLFALFAALAIGTKDQAYGMYLAAPIPVVVSDVLRRRRDDPGAPLWRSVVNLNLLSVIAVGALALAAIHNLPFNTSGAVERLRIMTGPITTQLREFPNTVEGQLDMLALGGRHLRFSFGLPFFAASLAGVALAAWRWRDHARALALLPLMAGYWFFLIVPLMYHYDRYLLPVALVLAVFGGYALSQLTAGRSVRATIGQGAVVAAIAYSIARAATVDVLLTTDARYDAERWMRQHIPEGSRTLAIGYDMYLPRFRHLHVITTSRPTSGQVDASDPEYLVLTSVFEEWRFRDDPDALAFFRDLRAGRTPYGLVYSHRSRPPLDLVSVAGVRTNLDKINPRIRIYRRARSGETPAAR